MTKLCARGKAAAKRKFKVYPSAYANAYASKICAGKAKDPSGVRRKDWGPKKASKGTMITDHAKTHRPRMNTETDQEYKKRTEYNGSHIKSEIGGEFVSNKSYEQYYKDLI